MQKKKCTAIVLAAGQGKRMMSKIQKQYLELDEKPIVYYSLKVFQESSVIDEIILVVDENQKEYCKTEIVDKYHFTKVTELVNGGAERYLSVRMGLQEIGHDGFVFIHDAARPFVSEEILQRAYEAVEECKACTIGVLSKDTVTVVDPDGYAKETPNRNYVWIVQTPQVFDVSLIKKAHAKLEEMEKVMKISVTDDAMVVEHMLGVRVRLVEGSYENIKITTPEDLEIANSFLKK